MGERLIINVFNKKDDETPLYNIYYHWSGFADSALEELLLLVENDCYKSIPEVVKFITKNGGTVVREDIPLYQETYDSSYEMPESASQNQGLVALSEEQINNSISWGEEFIDVYLDDNTFNIEKLFRFADDNILEDYDIDKDKCLHDVKFENQLSLDNIHILLDKIDYLKDNKAAVFVDEEYFIMSAW